MPHQINLKVTTGDKVYFLRDNKIHSGIVNKIIIQLIHIPGQWHQDADCKIVTYIYITIDLVHLTDPKSASDAGFYRHLNQVFHTKEELVQDLISKP